METWDANALPQGWRTQASREGLKLMGSDWLHQLRACVLRVPSAVVPAEFNFLINPLHPDVKHITHGPPETRDIDARLN